MDRYRNIALALLAIAPVAIAGCGEKSEPPTTGSVVTQSTTPTGLTTTDQTTTTSTDQTTTNQPVGNDRLQIIGAATDFLTQSGPTVCDSITPKLLRKAYGDRQGCVAARKPQALAKTYSIGPVQITGASASLQASAKGGGYGAGEKLKLMLVRGPGGDWRVDAVSSNARVGP